MSFAAIIFDFDGVIADSEVRANQSLAERLTAIGMPSTYDECLRDYYGHNWQETQRRIEARFGRPLPADFRDAVANIDYSSASAKINLALSEPPKFDCLPTDGIAPHHHGTIHIGETLDTLERAYDDAKYGLPSREPILEITLPSSVDDTISPEGKHVMSMFVQFAPYKLADGKHWDDIKEQFADTCIELLARYAPNVPNAVEHRQVLSPLDLERTFGLTGGNIMQGAMNFDQLYAMRPVMGWADHRTPIKGLYLCGAASHPGGGVMGACGKNAAEEILRDV